MADASPLFPRSLTAAVQTALADTPVVCIAGARQSGKTTLVRGLEPSRPFYTLDEGRYHHTAQLDPDGFIAGLPEFVTIDEVQRVPDLLRAIKLSVDRNRRYGRFLLTGSANILTVPTVSESLAGRMEIVVLHPLTEAEKERRPGRFLATLLAGELGARNQAPSTDSVPLVERLLQGGYPEPLSRSPERIRQWHRHYLDQLLQRDVREVSRVRRAGDLSRLLQLLAARTANLLNVNSLANALAISRITVSHYLAVLERMFLIRRLPSWGRAASRRFVRASKIHLTDSGLAATLAGRTTADWLGDRAAMGGLLESFVVQQLIAQAAWTDPDLRFWHYRDRHGNEVDLVITRGRETWGVEVKAATGVEPRDARGLRRLAAACGRDFRGGVVICTGQGVWRLGDPRIHSVGVDELWMR